MPVFQLGQHLRSVISRREEYRQGCLFPRIVPLRHNGSPADSSSHSRRRYQRHPLLHHAKLGRSVEAHRLVRRYHAVLLLAVSLLRPDHQLLILQQFRTQSGQVGNLDEP